MTATTEDNSIAASIGRSIGRSLSTLFWIFLTLKMTETGSVAEWSWWLVFLPFLIKVGFGIFSAMVIVTAEAQAKGK